MKIPSKNTCSFAICKTIYSHGDRTTGQLLSDLRERFVRNTIIDKVADMVDIGLLTRADDTLSIALPIRRYFEQCELDTMPRAEVAAHVTPGREARPFKPLTSYKLPIDGAREGADDHRQYKSRHF